MLSSSLLSSSRLSYRYTSLELAEQTCGANHTLTRYAGLQTLIIYRYRVTRSCEYLRTGWTSLLRGTGKPPPALVAGRGRPLRGGAMERVGVVVPEPWLDMTFMGWRRAKGDGAAGVRNLLEEGTGKKRRKKKNREDKREWQLREKSKDNRWNVRNRTEIYFIKDKTLKTE